MSPKFPALGQKPLKPITYAKAGGPPDDWAEMDVIDLDTGERVFVYEVNAKEGWAEIIMRDEYNFPLQDDVTGHFKTHRIKGRFEIRRK